MIRDPRSFLSALSKMQRWALRGFVGIFLLTLIILLRQFYYANTELVPKNGGTYIEGSVGQFQPINPWFILTNNVNRDIVSLVFSGLLKYDPATKQIVPDLASLIKSKDGKVYTLTLKQNVQWQDATLAFPHPVTADDVLFTFQTIQNPAFPNALLRQNFRGVSIEKINSQTVRFTLEEPYTYFTSNLTLGLLPKNSFAGVPVSKLDQALDFGFKPIGAGPYAFKSLIQTELSTEVTLERIQRAIDTQIFIKRVVFRIFPDYATLLSDIRNLDGVRLVPRNDHGEPIIPRKFTSIDYSLPQYVALFFNLEHPMLQDGKLRLGLQLGTNKQEIVDAIGEKTIVDTPLLELDASDWRYSFDANLAQGALFTSNWNLPEKVRLQRLLELKDMNATGDLHADPIVYLETGAALTLTGSFANIPQGSLVNGIRVTPLPAAASGSWIVALPTASGGTGSIHLGQNFIRLVDPKGKALDTLSLWRTADVAEFRKQNEEQNLLNLFTRSRAGTVPEKERISSQNLYLENGLLRRRQSTDPVGIRVNDRGERLSLHLLTSSTPPVYRKIAEQIQKEWATLGVHVGIDVPDTRAAFEKKLIARDYDILLFGQSLLDNLDSYPYWHSDGIQKLDGNSTNLRLDAYNFSQYSSFKADTLLKTIRQTSDEKERLAALNDLRTILKEDVPAIFLYSPLYTFAHHQDVHGIQIGRPSLHSDRFLTLPHWYVLEDRQFVTGKSWLSFLPWLFTRQ